MWWCSSPSGYQEFNPFLDYRPVGIWEGVGNTVLDVSRDSAPTHYTVGGNLLKFLISKMSATELNYSNL